LLHLVGFLALHTLLTMNGHRNLKQQSNPVLKKQKNQNVLLLWDFKHRSWRRSQYVLCTIGI